MGITITAESRHPINFDVVDLRMHMLGYVGDFDVWYDPNVPSYTVVSPVTSGMIVRNSLNYTDYTYLPTGDLAPQDRDVVLDPYHMCLLYQLIAEVGDPVKSRTGAE